MKSMQMLVVTFFLFFAYNAKAEVPPCAGGACGGQTTTVVRVGVAVQPYYGYGGGYGYGYPAYGAGYGYGYGTHGAYGYGYGGFGYGYGAGYGYGYGYYGRPAYACSPCGRGYPVYNNGFCGCRAARPFSLAIATPYFAFGLNIF